MGIFSDLFSRRVGLRFLFGKKETAVFNFTTFLCLAGVAIGVFAMVVVLCVMSGFESALKKRLFDSQVHVLVLPTDGLLPALEMQGAVARWKLLSSVKSVEPVLQTEVVIKEKRKFKRVGDESSISDRISGGVLKGVSQEYWQRISRQLVSPEQKPHKGSGGDSIPPSSQNRLFVGQELALELGIGLGDEVVLVSPLESASAQTPVGNVPQVKTFFVEGIYRAEGGEQEAQEIFAPLIAVESFLRQREVYSQVELRVDSPDDAAGIAQAVEQDAARDLAKSGGRSAYLVKSWSELNSHLFWSLKLERVAMICVLVFLILVASFSIVTTLSISIAEKGRSLGIMRALGATKAQIRNIVLWQGLGIGLVGVLGGGGAGLLVCLLLQKTNFIEMPEVYYDRTLPVEIRGSVFFLVICVVFLVVLFSSTLPLRQIKKLSAMSAIRAQR